METELQTNRKFPWTTLLRSLPAVGFALVSSLCLTVNGYSQVPTQSPVPISENNSAQQPASAPVVPSVLNSDRQVGSYAIGLDGDRGLDLATIFEEGFAQYSSYVVQLQLTSGTEQSIVVTAPPGGLQLEMRDMTGDNVPNDLVLTPTLLGWPLTVLVNDGHDHFTVAISGVLPNSVESGGNRASGTRNAHDIAALVFSSFKASGHTNRSSLLIPQLQESLFQPLGGVLAHYSDHRSS
jgi:hypothetical protein